MLFHHSYEQIRSHDVVVAAGTIAAAGVIAGRALWKDCVFLDRARQRDMLVKTALPRLRQIQAILERYPRSLQRAIAA